MRTLRLGGLTAFVALAGCGRGAPIWPVDVLGSPPDAPATPLCAALGASARRVVLAGVTGEFGCVQELRFVHGDGTVTLAGSLGTARARPNSCIYISDIEVKADGDFILAQRLTDGAMLFDRDGTRVTQAASLDAIRPALLQHGLWGLLDEVDGYNVLGKPSRGFIPVDRVDSGGGHFRGWMNPADRSVTPISVSVPLGAAEISFLGGAFCGVVKSSGAAQWLRVFPDETTLTPVPDYRGELYVNVKDRREGWVVIGSYEADRAWRVKEATGSVELLQPLVPPSLSQFRYAAQPGSRLYLDLDDDGGFLDTFRKDYGAGLFHSPDGVRDWTLIGREVTQLQFVYGRGSHGTYVVTSTDQPSSGQPVASWSTPPTSVPAPLSGSATQLVRPLSGVSFELPATDAVVLSQQGVCAAHFAAAGEVAVSDMNTGVTQTVAGVTGSRLTWLR